MSELNFHRANTLYATHGLHAFAAKCPPQLAEWAIHKYSTTGDVVCDPMAGSGTTLIEAWRHGRTSCGFDIDPLACLIARAKTTPVSDRPFRDANRALAQTIARLRDALGSPADNRLPDAWRLRYLPRDLPNLDYWFLADVQADLCLIRAAIEETDATSDVKTLWYAAFSSLIIARTSVANARDLVHSRHHHYPHPSVPDPVSRFHFRLKQMERQVRELREGAADLAAPRPLVACADSRALPLADRSVDLVLTSPPYCNALDYTRAHTFGVAWLSDVLDADVKAYVLRGRTYIGSERGTCTRESVATGVPEVDRIAEQVHAADARRGRLVAHYFADMQRVLHEAGRILRPGGHAVFVVCPSNIRRISIPWHTCFSALADKNDSACRLRQVDLFTRTLDDSRRVMPYLNGGQQFTNRMRTEHILVLQKAAASGQAACGEANAEA